MVLALAATVSPELAAAYARLYREHFPFVWRSLRRLGVFECDLSDAAQEVFLIVFRKLPELDLASRLSTWLFAVCLRVASDWRKKAYRRHELSGVELDGLTAEVSDKTRLTELRSLLWKALDGMPLDQRAVFVAFELEGFSGDEIARALGIPTPTVHSRLRLARERFRAVLHRERSQDNEQRGDAS